MSAQHTPHLATCRVCGEMTDSTNLIKYSTRHYAHAECAMQKWGCEFFGRIQPWQANNFPYFVAKKYGCEDAFFARAALTEAGIE